LLVLGEQSSQLASELMSTVAATVLLSVLLHGITAAPAARWYGRLTQRMGDSEEAEAVQEMRPRFRAD
ncbi:MAG: sodium:proton antiporter, partial [Alphaproteobacteria bacterium]